MKYAVDLALDVGKMSLPPRGAWIEIPDFQGIAEPKRVAPPTGSVD